MSNPGYIFLDLPFKGTRSYLHSTDIFPALNDLAHARFGSNAEVDTLTLRRPIRHAVLVSFVPLLDFSGTFRAKHDSGYAVGWLKESDKAITRRNPIDIPALPRTAEIGVDFARVSERPAGCATLELVVSLIKAVVAQVAEGQWWLSQIHFEKSLTDVAPLEIQLRRNFNQRFLALEIVEANKVVGFARVILDRETIS